MKTTKADEKALLEAESRYCSYGDTVHYLEPAKLFAGCNGSFLYDYEDKPYLDLQMWYSAVNFGYANPRLNDALKRQIDTLPQVASQYLHKEKIELAAMLCESIRDAWGEEGRVHFNVGGSQAIEDSLKLVRNACGGKSLMIAFEGGYHGRTLGASSITSSYRYRRRYGHFGERALFVPFPYCFRCPYGKRRDDCGMFCADQFERLFETEYYGVWDPKAGEAEYAAFYVECIQGTGGYVVPPDGYYPRLKKVLDERKIMLVDDEIIDYVLRMLAGFKVDATTLSTDLIKEVGPFGTYLAEMNTFEHLGDLSTYNLMNRRNYDMWAASGKPDLYGQARERAKEILATHKQKNPLSPEQVKAIRDVLVDAEGELGVADFWKGKEEKRFIDNDLY